MLINMRNGLMAGKKASGEYWGLCFRAEEPGVVINMKKSGNPAAVTLETSQDGAAWTAFDADGETTPITLARSGDRVFFRAGNIGNSSFASSVLDYRQFVFSGRTSSHGNIMSLIDGQSQSLVIPAEYCFAFLFKNCTSLTSAPILSATTLQPLCYREMFNGCSALTSVPYLPATNLPSQCYQSMFLYCTSITEIDIGAESVAAANSLTYLMRYCSSLSVVRIALKTAPSSTTIGLNWLQGVAATGTFYCPTSLGTDATIRRGISFCPTGWTVINTDAT